MIHRTLPGLTLWHLLGQPASGLETD